MAGDKDVVKDSKKAGSSSLIKNSGKADKAKSTVKVAGDAGNSSGKKVADNDVSLNDVMSVILEMKKSQQEQS
jgi:type V secretory pathway adhesin AidA